MARIRSIKPDFPQSESMGRVSRDARLCFMLSWTVADDAGRFRGNSRMLASLLFPYDADAFKKIDGWYSELESEHCVRRYLVNGDSYIEIVNWLKHQKIDKPSTSKLPGFGERSLNGSAHSRVPREDSRGLGIGREGKGEEGNGSGGEHSSVDAAAFDEFWKAYPKKRSKGDAEKVWAKLKPNSELVERIMSALTRATTCKDWTKDDGQFIPHPHKWLKSKGWDNDVGAGNELKGLV